MTKSQLAARRGVELGVIVQTPSGGLAARRPGLAGEDLAEADRILAFLGDHRAEVLADAERVFAARRRPPARFE